MAIPTHGGYGGGGCNILRTNSDVGMDGDPAAAAAAATATTTATECAGPCGASARVVGGVAVNATDDAPCLARGVFVSHGPVRIHQVVRRRKLRWRCGRGKRSSR